MADIVVAGLNKTYRVPVRNAGLREATRSLFRREYRLIEAVQPLSFSIQRGEVVGFLGPNGAGKTTTLKMLSGILHPTAGHVDVLGCVPSKREGRFLQQIAMVRGSRPIGAPPELTVSDALHFQQLIYEMPSDQFHRTVTELIDMLDLEPLLQRQIRQLSLGERMRAGLAWSLSYRPRVLFLDEPTIGLDVSVAEAMRLFIAYYSQQFGATVLLTSHYMADVEALCRRVILIDKGTMLYDGELARLTARLAPYKLVKIATRNSGQVPWEQYGPVAAANDSGAELRIAREDIPAVTSRLLADLLVSDLTIEDPPIESTIAGIYRDGLVS